MKAAFTATGTWAAGNLIRIAIYKDGALFKQASNYAGTANNGHAFIAVDVGDTITFVPSDASHNVQSIVVPEGAKTFNTQMGATVTLSFDQEGAYFYKCTPHFMLGMLGMVQVGNAVNKAAIESN